MGQKERRRKRVCSPKACESVVPREDSCGPNMSLFCWALPSAREFLNAQALAGPGIHDDTHGALFLLRACSRSVQLLYTLAARHPLSTGRYSGSGASPTKALGSAPPKRRLPDSQSEQRRCRLRTSGRSRCPLPCHREFKPRRIPSVGGLRRRLWMPLRDTVIFEATSSAIRNAIFEAADGLARVPLNSRSWACYGRDLLHVDWPILAPRRPSGFAEAWEFPPSVPRLLAPPPATRREPQVQIPSHRCPLCGTGFHILPSGPRSCVWRLGWSPPLCRQLALPRESPSVQRSARDFEKGPRIAGYLQHQPPPALRSARVSSLPRCPSLKAL